MEELICLFMYISLNIILAYILKITSMKDIPNIS